MDGHELLEQYLSGVRSFQSADLRGIKFENADFSGADFSGADLSGANFRGTNFSGTIFREANLRGADLSHTKQWGTVLPGSLF
jgi:uncharacterized protein YjbI with pentapeptide repeats